MMCERTKGEAPFTNLLEIQHYKDKKYTKTKQTNTHTHKKKKKKHYYESYWQSKKEN